MTCSPLLTSTPASATMPQAYTAQSGRSAQSQAPPPGYYQPKAATPRSRGFGTPINDIDLSRAYTTESRQQQDNSAPAYTLASNEPVPPSYGASKHGLFGSEEEYLAELSRWAERKQHASAGPQALVGFYGSKTCADILNIDKKKVGLAGPSVGESSVTGIPADFDPDDLYDDDVLDEEQTAEKKKEKKHRRTSSLVPSFLRRKKTHEDDN